MGLLSVLWGRSCNDVLYLISSLDYFLINVMLNSSVRVLYNFNQVYLLIHSCHLCRSIWFQSRLFRSFKCLLFLTVLQYLHQVTIIIFFIGQIYPRYLFWYFRMGISISPYVSSKSSFSQSNFCLFWSNDYNRLFFYSLWYILPHELTSSMILSGILKSVSLLGFFTIPVFKSNTFRVPWILPVGTKYIPGHVMDLLVLFMSVSSLASTYSPHWNLKCTSNNNSLLVIISHGDSTYEITCVAGEPLRNITENYTRWMTNWLGRILYGRLEVKSRQRYLITHIVSSIYPTFYLVTVVIIFTIPASSLTLSNYWSMRIVITKILI